MEKPLRLVFNFAASFSAGGLERLLRFAKFFNDQPAESCFFIHPNAKRFCEEFKKCSFIPVLPDPIARLRDDLFFIKTNQYQDHDFFYSYGVPITRRVARCNWFHLSNIIAISQKQIPLKPLHRVKYGILKWKIRQSLQYTDILSAESQSSAALFREFADREVFVSPNGADDQIREFTRQQATEPVAVAVGTYRHKQIPQTVEIFRHLRKGNPQLRLVVFGPALPGFPDVEFRGEKPHAEVIQTLAKAEFFISTSAAENSFNAAAEGVYLARQSIISAIPPHLELLSGQKHGTVRFETLGEPYLTCQKKDLDVARLKPWSQIAGETLAHAQGFLRRN